MKKTSRIYKSVEAFFIKNKWQFSIDEKSNDMHMEFQGIHAKWICSAHSYEDRNQFVFYSNIPVQVPKEKRMLISEFLTRSNSKEKPSQMMRCPFLGKLLPSCSIRKPLSVE